MSWARMHRGGEKRTEERVQDRESHRDRWQPTDGHERGCLGGSPPWRETGNGGTT